MKMKNDKKLIKKYKKELARWEGIQNKIDYHSIVRLTNI